MASVSDLTAPSVCLSHSPPLPSRPLPEFQPGVPWKGIQSVDPESDPYMTPGSMLSSAGAHTLNDTEHQLLRDNTGTKNSPRGPQRQPVA